MKIYRDGKSRNIIGPKVRDLRKKEKISQRVLAARLQTRGLDCTDLTILRIEQGKRFVPDYEVAAIASYFGVAADYLLNDAGADSGDEKHNPKR